MEKVTFSVIGLGGRANVYLSALEQNFPTEFELIAIAEPDRAKQKHYQDRFQVKDQYIFNSDIDFLKQERLSDVAIVATQDQLHVPEVIALLEKGYDIILEKPIATKMEEVVRLAKIAQQYPQQQIVVCHVLRYTKLFQTIKAIIDSKKLGNVINIQHNENIGYYHFAHSYVRGPWRNLEESSPLVVAKSCHDMDILLYLLNDKHCLRLSSFGSLSFFKKANFDEQKMAKYCTDCQIETNCPYSAVKIYSQNKIKSVAFDLTSKEQFDLDLKNSPYGRCVFNCDNNVADHQVTILEFEDGITATFNLSAFTSKVKRTLKIMCEYGEIRACEKPYTIEVHDFRDDEPYVINLDVEGGHGGGDMNFIISFMNEYRNKRESISSLSASIESHIMAFLAERSRLDNGKPYDVKRVMEEIY